MGTVAEALELISTGIGLIGGLIMIVGVAVSFYRLSLIEFAAWRKRDVEHDRISLRNHLGYYILLGLEFIVVADVLLTILHPGLQEILILGVVVLIRTVIGITLHWELGRNEQIKANHP